MRAGLLTGLPVAEVPAAGGRGIAVFDFDGTLIEGDSLLPFLERVVGRTRTRLSFARAVRGAIALHARRRPLGPDIRTSVKAILLRETLAGVPTAEAEAAAARLPGWIRWKAKVRDALIEHRRAGRHIVVATGALSLYMPRLLDGLPVDALLATDVEAVDGVLTGHMPRGNCVRALKAERVRAYMDAHGPFGESWGYGNRPSDLPMLALMDHRVVI